MTAALLPPAVVVLPDEKLIDAAAILAQAFMGDPALRYCLDDQGTYYSRAVRALSHLSCTRRAASGGLHFGAQRDGALVGVAGLTPPGRAPQSTAVRASATWLAALLGPRAVERLERLDALVERHRPAGAHFTLGALGVLPDARDQGRGGALFDAIHAHAESHPVAKGVYLDTTTPATVLSLQRFGYEIVGRDKLDALSVWCLFRPNGGR